MGTTEIPSECLWSEQWSVWGYLEAELAQSSFKGVFLCVKGGLVIQWAEGGGGGGGVLYDVHI